MGKVYLEDAVTNLTVHITETRATDLTAERATECAIACQISNGVFALTGIRPEFVRVYRTMLHVRMLGHTFRYEAGRKAMAGIRSFDDPAIRVFPEGDVVYLAPTDRRPDGKLPGSGHTGKSNTAPAHKAVAQNHNRRKSV